MRDVSDRSDKKIMYEFKKANNLIDNDYETAKKNVLSTVVEQDNQTSATLIFARDCPVIRVFSDSEKVIIRQTMQDLNTYLRTLLKICHEYQRMKSYIEYEFTENSFCVRPDLKTIEVIETLHDIITDLAGIVKIIDKRGHDCGRTAQYRNECVKKFTAGLDYLQNTEFGAHDQSANYQASPDFRQLAYEEVNDFGEVIFHPEITTFPAPIYLGTGERPSSVFACNPFLSGRKLANFSLDLRGTHAAKKALEDQCIKINRSDDYSYRLGLVEARKCIKMPSGEGLFVTACTNTEVYPKPDLFKPSLHIRSDMFELGTTNSERIVMMFGELYRCYYLVPYLGGVSTPRRLLQDLIDDGESSDSE